MSVTGGADMSALGDAASSGNRRAWMVIGRPDFIPENGVSETKRVGKRGYNGGLGSM